MRNWLSTTSDATSLPSPIGASSVVVPYRSLLSNTLHPQIETSFSYKWTFRVACPSHRSLYPPACLIRLSASRIYPVHTLPQISTFMEVDVIVYYSVNSYIFLPGSHCLIDSPSSAGFENLCSTAIIRGNPAFLSQFARRHRFYCFFTSQLVR